MRLASSGGRRASAAALDAQKNYSIDEGRVVSRKEFAAAARDAMKALRLNPAMRHVLAELVGCWGEKMVGEQCLVWPSNEYLVERTGLSERSVRYGVRGLVEMKLVTPRDSANGKRFAVKTKAGEVKDAYGFDLTPLYARRGEWAGTLLEIQAEKDRIRRMFDDITICRRAAEEALIALKTEFPDKWKPEIAEEMEGIVARLPRRRAAPSDTLLESVLGEVRAIRAKAEEAFYNAACDGNDCRHIETTKESIQDSSLSELPKEVEAREYSSITPGFASPGLKLILDACPAVGEYANAVETEADLVAAGRFIRGALGAHESAWNEAVKVLGPVRAAIVVAITLQLHVDDVASGKNHIKNPGGYFRALMRLVAAGKMNLQTELLTMSRRRNLGATP
jgi:replication initiation protein RepC